MRKLTLWIIVLVSANCLVDNATGMTSSIKAPLWNGFFVKANTGLWSKNNIVNNYGRLETYASTVTVKKNIPWLAGVNEKMSFRVLPAIMVYGTGGLACGGITLNQPITARESIGPLSYPNVSMQNNISKTRLGWMVGTGIEWAFKSQWSAKIEYAYYDHGSAEKNHMTLNENTAVNVTPLIWDIANVKASTRLATEALHLGLNYRFG